MKVLKVLRGLDERLNVMLLMVSGSVRSEKGQTLVEYGLLLVLIAVVVYLMVTGVGTQTNCFYSKIDNALGGAGSG